MRPRRIAAENIAHAAGNLCLVAEELADVTQAAWAPAGWSIATRKDRYQGLTIIGASQRPAAIDRHFFGNATTIRTGWLNFEADVACLARTCRRSRKPRSST